MRQIVAVEIVRDAHGQRIAVTYDDGVTDVGAVVADQRVLDRARAVRAALSAAKPVGAP